MTGAMNLTEEQRDALSTLPIGTAVVRLADEHPEPFLIRVPRCLIQEGLVTDSDVRARMATYSTNSNEHQAPSISIGAVSPISSPDKYKDDQNISRPPSPMESSRPTSSSRSNDSVIQPPEESFTREEIRFLADIVGHPLSTTVVRYSRLHLSRRRGNAVRQSLETAGLLEAVPIATRSGQVVLYQLTPSGGTACAALGIDPGPPPRAGLEHRYWVARVAEHFERQGYDITHEFHIPGDGHVDLVAERPGERVAIEVETGKSDIKANLDKLRGAGFDRIVLLATGPSAVAACHRALETVDPNARGSIEIQSWLDIP